MGAVALVIAISCANVAGLLLAPWFGASARDRTAARGRGERMAAASAGRRRRNRARSGRSCRRTHSRLRRCRRAFGPGARTSAGSRGQSRRSRAGIHPYRNACDGCRVRSRADVARLESSSERRAQRSWNETSRKRACVRDTDRADDQRSRAGARSLDWCSALPSELHEREECGRQASTQPASSRRS
jgi:hypothetical protein